MNVSYLMDYQAPRENMRLSRNDVAALLVDRGIEISTESLGCYERGVRDPSPGMVIELADIYNEPFLTQKYCKYCCKIGQAYSYEMLDNVDLNLSNVALKLLEEHRESHEVLAETLILITNKRTEADFTEEELSRLKKNVHELLDTEHTIEIFKITLNKFINMKAMIAEHNEKCRQRGYSKRWTSKKKEVIEMTKLVEKIVFSGIDGRALIPLLIVLIFVVIGQVGEIIEEIKKPWKEVD